MLNRHFQYLEKEETSKTIFLGENLYGGAFSCYQKRIYYTRHVNKHPAALVYEHDSREIPGRNGNNSNSDYTTLALLQFWRKYFQTINKLVSMYKTRYCTCITADFSAENHISRCLRCIKGNALLIRNCQYHFISVVIIFISLWKNIIIDFPSICRLHQLSLCQKHAFETLNACHSKRRIIDHRA